MDRRQFISSLAAGSVVAAVGCAPPKKKKKSKKKPVAEDAAPKKEPVVESPQEEASNFAQPDEPKPAPEVKPATPGTWPKIGDFELDGKEYKPTSEENGIAWYNLADMPIEGRGWAGEERPGPFSRLPKRWMDKVPEGVRSLSLDSTGMGFRFRTNGAPISVRYRLRMTPNHKFHWAATGTSSIDLYARDSEGTMRFYANTKSDKQDMTNVFKDMPPADREYLLYFPLINGLERMELGLPKGASFQVMVPKNKPLVIYGSSVANGGCASRPGMACLAIISRRMNLPYISLGFAGSARMEPVMADVVSELDASAYVLDCVPNMWCEWIPERFNSFIKKMRAKHPDTPIVMVEDAVAPHSWLNAGRAEHHRKKHEAHRKEYQRLVDEGVKGLFYVEGDHLFPEDGEGSVDNVHPTDYGFIRHADVIGAVVQKALGY